MSFPPGMRRIDPQAEADRLAEQRKAASGTPAPAKLTASASCQGCGMSGNAEGLAYVTRLLSESATHAGQTGHEVRTEVWARPAG